MKAIFDYINNNSFLATIIGIFLGWILNFISTMYFYIREEQQKNKREAELEKKKQYKNRPELHIEQNDETKDIDISIFIGTFEVNYNQDEKYKITFSKNIKNNHDYKDVIIKNIGKSAIECLDIVSTNKRSLILVDYDSLNNLVDSESVWYSYCYDKKILVGEKIKIRIYFEKDKQPYTLFSSTLAFLFEDQNHNYWEQPFFYEKDNVYSPYKISYKEFKQKINADDAYDCFEQPWLW